MVDNGRKMIASLALFRQLYRNESTDTLVLLSDFIKLIIKNHNLYIFTASDIRNRLYTEYNFSIPDTVVESALKKFCNKQFGNYRIKENVVFPSENTCTIEDSNNEIINKLITYIEDRKNINLSSSEKEEIVQSFCEFIIEDTTQIKYADYISAFLIECQNDNNIREQLKSIKEGVILYTGIKYNDNISEVGSWKNNFTIYLEQEMLFHFVGYNGDLYKRLFDDFIELVREVNRKAKTEIIKLRYFPEVESNINKFFSIAQRITDGKETLDPSNTAMVEITNGCADGTDVLTKKSHFYDLLNKSLIQVSDEIYISDKENIPYNIYTKDKENELIQNIPDCSIESIQQSLTFVNYINICRKSKCTSFERSKCILLTGNSTTLKVDSSLKENGYVPYTTTLDFITNRIWRKLNKGFGDNKYPKSFDVITKAQIVLASHIAGSVSKEFEKIKQDFANGRITKELAAQTLVSLKEQVLKPEDINSENTNHALITISDAERGKRELENQRYELKLAREENEVIKKEKRREEEKNKLTADALFATNRELLNERINRLQIELNKKEKVDKKCKIWNKIILIINIVLPIILIAIICILIRYFSWDIMEQWTYILSLLVWVLQYVFCVIIGHSFNPEVALAKINKYIKDRLYQKYEVKEAEIDRLKTLTSVESTNNII
ncbi:MAG: hypothetical protein NC038_02885 [Paludibacter sp.]|nr:hypothetical protein [Bacteroidales bacterium]MCM1069023.1 hypothetical protein [Prevotella sp.]MCM1353686.1 hypothetical protein [Bacteroides sp.]MCM1441965.1 hypothetical protein [Muribaculum sp.]MCM1481579.1 hypothetical protein [Paludibacter sp.]